MGVRLTFNRIQLIVVAHCRQFCIKTSTKESPPVMKYLNVAEKNDAAKNIAAILSRGNSNRREGLSQYNKIYEFDATVLGQQARMVMTSVSGHLLNYAFAATFKNWRSCHPAALFEAPVSKVCLPDYDKIKRTLVREVRSCQGLIIWTDCDREGENIGFEIIQVCREVKPNLPVYRAKFSEITAASVFRALNNLGHPDENVSKAVDVRQELDLRTGAAFTRLQTLRLQKVFPAKLADKLISYGSCQFPTLGFVVERYQSIEAFQEEPFWKIKMSHTVGQLTTEFVWRRERLFEREACQAILDICEENRRATVESVDSRPKSKWRPLPLDTVELEKNASRKLKINAKETMRIAEKLYTSGFISYPRTETNIFPKELNLVPLVEQQQVDNNWGDFGRRILNEGGPNPRQGKKSDQAHPPIHPTKYAPNLQGNEKRVYEFIVRHFLACVHKDAQGFETCVNVDVAGEKFQAKGLIILERNYLDVYVYEKWNAKEINNYQNGQQFDPTTLEMVDGKTAPPKLLTEADLIALMEKHGIGTDATHAEHIDTIKQREYVGLHDNIYFVPGRLGMGLVEGYNEIGLEISLAKPNLRADFEKDLKLICEGRKDAEMVRREQIEKYKAAFLTVAERMQLIDQCLANRLEDQPAQVADIDLDAPNDGAGVRSLLKCPKCGNDMFLRDKKNGNGKFVSCTGYPECRNAIWLPDDLESVEVTDQNCRTCGPNTKMVKIKFRRNPFPGEPNPNTLCIAGCDLNVIETLNINANALRRRSNNMDGENVQNVEQRRPPPPPPPAPPAVRVTPNNNPPNNGNVSRNNRNSFGNNSFHGNDDDDNNSNKIVCNCDTEAILLTVNKDGPNKGRKFYKCQKSTCNFFLWAPDGATSAPNSHNNTTIVGPNEEVECKCHQPAVIRTVSKEGPNKGREFYCCAKPMGQGCGFFKWASDLEQSGFAGGGGGGPGPGGSGYGGGSSRGGRGGGKMSNKSKKKRNNPYDGGDESKKSRKCGICGEIGHTRAKCPNK